MKTYICVMSPRGLELAKKLKEGLYQEAMIYAPKSYVQEGSYPYPLEKPIRSLGYLFNELKSKQLYESNRMIFIMAMGIALRGMSGHIEDKTTDPGCILMDEQGDFVISLLSGHLGGANEDSRKIAHYLKAIPVITTATDRAGLGALDEIAKEVRADHPHLKDLILRINKGLLQGMRIGLYSDYPLTHTKGFIKIDDLEKVKDYSLDEFIIVSHQKSYVEKFPKAIHLIPKRIIIGTGAKKGLDKDIYQKGLSKFIDAENIHPRSIAAFVSIDLKKEEYCIKETARCYKAEFRTYPKEVLARWESLYPTSDFVKSKVGVGSVAYTSVHEVAGSVCSKRFQYQGATFVYGIEKGK